MPRHNASSSTRRRRPTSQRRRPSAWIGAIILGVLVIAGMGTRSARPAADAADAQRAVPQATDACRGLPAFVQNPELGMAGSLILATDRPEMGLVLDATERSGPPYQHPTWDDAGYLGSIAYDAAGNIYAAPTPRTSLTDNPLEGAGTLWRVDTSTGAMTPFVTLPGAATERNPYGVLGLTYVCGLDRLYAGSVLGSTPTTEQGGVVAIDLASGAQTPILEHADSMGVQVVAVGNGYDLYAGLARSPEILAVALDAQGNPRAAPRLVLDLTEAGAAPSERARKIRLAGELLIVDLVPFNYSLQSSARDRPPLRRAIWRYTTDTGAWEVVQPAHDVELPQRRSTLPTGADVYALHTEENQDATYRYPYGSGLGRDRVLLAADSLRQEPLAGVVRSCVREHRQPRSAGVGARGCRGGHRQGV